MLDFPSLLQWLVWVILGISGVVYLWAQVRRQSHREALSLAETRGARIDDLEDQVGRLREKVEHLQGSLEAYQRIKAEEIAVEVARLLEPRLPRLEGA